MRKALVEIQSSKFFNTLALESPFSIIVDGDWVESSGYQANDLKTPSGTEAVLIGALDLKNPEALKSTLAHELTHLSHGRHRPQESSSWLREGVALLGQWLLTGQYPRATLDGFQNPELTLMHSFDPKDPAYKAGSELSGAYGNIFLYMQYLYRLCGKNELFEQLLTAKDASTGIKFVDDVLKRLQSKSAVCQSFESSFKAFEIARFKQNFNFDESYVMLMSERSPVRLSPTSLPAYSSEAYQRGGRACELPDDLPWGKSVCIRVRLD